MQAANVNATGALSIEAGSIDIESVSNSSYRSSKSSSKSWSSSKISTNKSFSSENLGSDLAGATVLLVTNAGDIDITGSRLQAETQMALESAGDIRIAAGKNESLVESHRQKSSWFSGGSIFSEKEDLAGRVTQTAVSSQISAASLSLHADEDIELVGAEIGVDDSLRATAQNISVENAYNEDTRYSKHTEISVSMNDLVSNAGNLDELVSEEDGKLTLSLAKASYSNAESFSQNNTAVSSLIQAGNIEFNAYEAGDEAGDILIRGSDLVADDSITLNAGGDVAILESKSVSSSEDLTQEGSAELKFTFQNEYDQAIRAIQAVKDSERDLRHAKEAYDDYRDDLAEQKQKLEQLRVQFANGEGFVEQADVDEFQRRLNRLEGDKEFYQANIVLATATLASKTTALVQQIGRAAASSGTYGFNVSLQLDIDALEQEVNQYYEQNVASTLSANEIAINAGDSTVIRGSNLLAQDSIDIDAEHIDIQAAASHSRQSDRQQQINISQSWDMLSAADAPVPNPAVDAESLGGSISGSSSKTTSNSTRYTNSQLLAANIRLNASADMRIQGANVHADETLEINTRNLTLASVQDSSYSETRSGGVSYSGSGSGVNAANSENEHLQTQLTRLSGGQVNIQVQDHTDIQGAVIAAIDEKGKDNGQLNLSTNTLSAGSLINTVQNDSQSLGLNAGSTSSLDYQDDSRSGRTKSLATIGSGDIQITDVEGSDLRMLNSDIENSEVAIYDLESHQGLNGELDTRLLSEGGRKQIAEDWLRSSMIANSISLIVSTERVGIEDFFDETEKSHLTYEAVKTEISKDPQLAEMLQDAALNPEQKQQMLDQLTDAVMIKLGYETHDNLIIATEETASNGKGVMGFYSEEDKQVYINDLENENTRELFITAGHEASHAIDNHLSDSGKPTASSVDNEEYAENFGTSLADYAEFSLSYNGYDPLAQSNEHIGNESAVVSQNNLSSEGLDHRKWDYRLTEKQKADRAAEIQACSNTFCKKRVNLNYSLVSVSQGVAETAGVASGAVSQVVEDIRELVRTIDFLVENPEKSEEVATQFVNFANRVNEIADGDDISKREAQLIGEAVTSFAMHAYEVVDDAGTLDGEGIEAPFHEGKNYGIYLASSIPISRLMRLLKLPDSNGPLTDSKVSEDMPILDVSLGKNQISEAAIEKSTELTPVVVSTFPNEINYQTSSGVKLVADSERTTTILGNYRMDMSNIIEELNYPKTLDFDSKQGGFNLLNAPDSLYRDSDQFWEQYNKPFLDQAIDRNDSILLATQPTKRVLVNVETGEATGYGRELKYLNNRGYDFDPDELKMINKD